MPGQELGDMGFSMERLGGPMDGEKFSLVRCQKADGSVELVWMSSVRFGKFKRVFVPVDFQHPQIVE